MPIIRLAGAVFWGILVVLRFVSRTGGRILLKFTFRELLRKSRLNDVLRLGVFCPLRSFSHFFV